MGRISTAAGGYVVYGVRSVAFILISQFYAFRHVITKGLELKKYDIEVAFNATIHTKFFFEPLNLMGNLKDSLRCTLSSHMRVFFVSEGPRCRHVIRT